MTSHGAVAAKVRQDREEHPERYCTQCLWRIQGPRSSPCPRHPVPASAPFPGYDVRAMTYHGGNVSAENAVDDRAHIANDRAEADELRDHDEEC